MTRPGGFEQYGPTIRVEGGLKAQSTRGAIGESWWSKRFLAVLESFAMGSRLTRGPQLRPRRPGALARHPARRGRVKGAGLAAAAVHSGHQAAMRTTDPTWTRIEQALASQALFRARLLAGEMPTQIEEVFAAADAPLFPTRSSDLAMSCSCPDWGVPCKHIAATFYLLAEAFDADPFQILHWRGRDRETLLANLRTLRRTGADEATPRRTKRRKAKPTLEPSPSPGDRCRRGTARHEQPGPGRDRGPVLGFARPTAAPATHARHRRRPGAASAARARPGAGRRRALREAASPVRHLPTLTVLSR